MVGMSLPAAATSSTVLITGASSGIGTELARELASRGYNLTLVARREDRLRALSDELASAHAIRADIHMTDLADADARADLTLALLSGQLDVVGVCNNAGFGSVGRLHELPLEREARMVRVNVNALHELTGAFLPRMVGRGSGAVLNVASTAAFQPIPGFATYGATKAFVTSFSEAVHAELSGTGVSVTSLCPGPTRTEFFEHSGTPALHKADFLFMAPREVARQAVDAMIAGKRTLIPGASNKATAVGGRFVPRSLFLPAMRRLGAGRRADAASELT